METADHKPTFGELFRDLRTRGKLSQRKVAGVLGLAESTIARIEAGTRKPPRDASFYEGLRNIPGFTEPEIAALLRTGNAPRWLIGNSADQDIPRIILEAPQGIRLFVYDDKNVLKPEEMNIIKEDLNLLVNDLFQRRIRRAELLDKYLPQ